MTLVKLQHNFEISHFEFQEKVIEYFKCRHDKFFKSQKFLQLFKLESKKPLKNPTGFIFNTINVDSYCIKQITNTKLFEVLNNF